MRAIRTSNLILDNHPFFQLQAVVGPLSPDFLRLSTARDIQESTDRQAAIAIYQQQQNAAAYMVSRIIINLACSSKTNRMTRISSINVN